MKIERSSLDVSLEGCRQQLLKIAAQLADLKTMGHGNANHVAKSTPVKKPRNISKAARNRIADAQKRRWDDYRKAKEVEMKARRRA